MHFPRWNLSLQIFKKVHIRTVKISHRKFFASNFDLFSSSKNFHSVKLHHGKICMKKFQRDKYCARQNLQEVRFSAAKNYIGNVCNAEVYNGRKCSGKLPVICVDKLVKKDSEESNHTILYIYIEESNHTILYIFNYYLEII